MKLHNLLFVAVMGIIMLTLTVDSRITILDDFETACKQIATQITDTDVPPVTTTQSCNGSNTATTIGLERDQILTLTNGSINKPVISVVSKGLWSNSFSQNTQGFSVMQYDGIDGSPNVTFPGLGGFDLTQDLSAYAFYLNMSSDLAVNYTVRVYGGDINTKSEYTVLYSPALDEVNIFTTFIVPFSLFVGNASFSSIGAIELINIVPNDIDSKLALFGVFGYEVSGTVFYDCNSDGVQGGNELPLPGATVTITELSNSQQRVTTTDANGDYFFFALQDEGTYQVCVSNTNATATIPASGCRNVTLKDLLDVTEVNFGYTVAATFTAPNNTVINCGDCNTTSCLGDAVVRGCGAQPVPTHVDTTTGVCPTIITRTFSATGFSNVVQTITVQDIVAPQITVPAQNVNTSCASPNETLSAWVNRRAGSAATDCSSFNNSNNLNGRTLSNGCSSIDVTFTYTDICGNANSTTGTYALFDLTAPTFSTNANNTVVECTSNGSDITSLNNWLAAHGGAVASDACTATGSLVWNNPTATILSGCDNTQTTNFTVTDQCGNTNSTLGSFTIHDTTKPTISTPAQSLNVSCGSGASTAYATWVANHGNANATDACNSGITWVNNAPAFPAGETCGGVATVTFTAIDSCGLNATTTATFTVTNSAGPSFSTPASPLSVDCTNGSANATITAWLNDNGGADASDSCTAIDWSHNFTGTVGSSCSNVTVGFTACNRCNPVKCSTTTTTLSIVDKNPPVFNDPPETVSNECAAGANSTFPSWLSTAGNANVTDDCSGGNVVITENFSGTTLPLPVNGCNSSAVVTFRATDACGNNATAIGTYTIRDTNPPVVTPTSPLSLECASTGNTNQNTYNSWLTSHANATATDACSGNNVSWSNNATSKVAVSCNNTAIVAFSVTDPCGLTSVVTSSVTVQDTLAPVISKNATSSTSSCTSDFANTLTLWLGNNAGAVATDACTNVTWTNDFISLSTGCTQAAIVTFTVSDTCGHSSNTTATFTVNDNQPPVITQQAQNTTVSCSEDTGAALVAYFNNNGGATAEDLCQPSTSLVWDHTVDTQATQCGAVPFTFSVTDGCGEFSTTTSYFIVTDQERPTISPQAASISVECDGSGNVQQYADWVATRGGANAQDTCTVNLKWTTNAKKNGPVGCGTTTATFTVSDGCNNAASTTATFTVIDTTPPAISPPASTRAVECSETNAASLRDWLNSNGGASATDVCTSNSALLKWTHAIVGTNVSVATCTNTTQYQFTVTDQCGKSSTTIADFVITDTLAPTITDPAVDLVLECNEFTEDDIDDWLASNGGAKAKDNCSKVYWANNYSDHGELTCVVEEVIFTVVDFCGNSAFTSANLIIEDSAGPEFEYFPPDIHLPCESSIAPEYTGWPEVDDACTEILQEKLRYTDSQVQNPDYEPTLCPGAYVITRTWTVEDDCGNSLTRDQIITVEIAYATGTCNNTCDICNTDCCPKPDPVPCVAVACEAHPCSSSFCAAPYCTCPNDKRDVHGDFSVNPNEECEPVYIFINDDDENEVVMQENSVAVQKLVTHLIYAEEPLSEDKVQELKRNRKVINKRPKSFMEFLSILFVKLTTSLLNLF